jgi:NADPH2:quinone reductase
MKAVILEAYGPPENLKLVEVPIPEPKDDEVLIKVQAASVIFADSMVRRGVYIRQLASPPFIPGREVTGTIEKGGTGVKNIKLGTKVAATVLTGGYAEYTTASVKNIVYLPEKVSFLQGLVYLTNLRIAYLAYYVFGQIQPMDTILLHAPAGGVGTLITQIAKRRANNVVIALSSSQEKLEYCLANGADYGVNYKAADYVEEVLHLTGEKGVDVSLNSVSGPTLEKDPYVIKPLGRWVIYGAAAGYGTIDPQKMVAAKSLTVIHFSVYSVLEREEYRQATKFLENWLHTEELISVSRTFPFEEVAAAHHWIDNQHSVGKIALVM